LENRSSAPAFYTVVTLGFSQEIKFERFGEFKSVGTITSDDGHTLNYMYMKLGIPGNFPVFKGIIVSINELNTLRLGVRETPPNDEFLLRCKVQSPGFQSVQDWVIRKRGRQLQLRPTNNLRDLIKLVELEA
jgi:hypothetical protein